MFKSQDLSLKKLLTAILTACFLSLFITSCSTDSGSGGASLDGDLSYQVEGDEGEEVFLSYNAYSSSELNFETMGNVTVSANGTVEGDLPDGDFTGYQLQASPVGEDEPAITLRLLSDGNVLGETSEVNSEGIFMVEVGDIPNFEE